MAVDYDATTYFYDEWGRACPVYSADDVNSFDIGVYDYEIDISLHGDRKTVYIEWEDEENDGFILPRGIGWYKNVDGENKRVLSVDSATTYADGSNMKSKVTVWRLANDEQVSIESTIRWK